MQSKAHAIINKIIAITTRSKFSVGFSAISINYVHSTLLMFPYPISCVKFLS